MYEINYLTSNIRTAEVQNKHLSKTLVPSLLLNLNCVWVHTAGYYIGNSLRREKDSSQWQTGVKDLPALSASDLCKGHCRAVVRDLDMMSHSDSPAAVSGKENWDNFNFHQKIFTDFLCLQRESFALARYGI